MRRINVGGGAWFDADRATRYQEDNYFDGRNHVSLATGSQWEHEELWRTRKGKWYLCSWSQWQGSGPASYREISEGKAHAWLAKHGHDAAIPKPALEALEV